MTTTTLTSIPSESAREQLRLSLEESFPMTIVDKQGQFLIFGNYLFREIFKVAEDTPVSYGSVNDSKPQFTLNFKEARKIAVSHPLLKSIKVSLLVGEEVTLCKNNEAFEFSPQSIQLKVSKHILVKTISYTIPLLSLQSHYSAKDRHTVQAQIDAGTAGKILDWLGMSIPDPLLIKPQHIFDAL